MSEIVPVMLNEAKTSRLSYEAETEAEASFWTLRPRPKIITKKVPNSD